MVTAVGHLVYMLTINVPLFTYISVPVDLEVINRKCTEHMSQEEMENFLEHTCFIPKDKLISLLALVLKNYVFSFMGKSYQQLQGAAMSSSVSPVIANIYMEYFEVMALGPQCPIPTPWWKRYVDDDKYSYKR